MRQQLCPVWWHFSSRTTPPAEGIHLCVATAEVKELHHGTLYTHCSHNRMAAQQEAVQVSSEAGTWGTGSLPALQIYNPEWIWLGCNLLGGDWLQLVVRGELWPHWSGSTWVRTPLQEVSGSRNVLFPRPARPEPVHHTWLTCALSWGEARTCGAQPALLPRALHKGIFSWRLSVTSTFGWVAD